MARQRKALLSPSRGTACSPACAMNPGFYELIRHRAAGVVVTGY
jgi:hypothetical protein